MSARRLVLAACLFLASMSGALPARADVASTWQRPRQEILDVLHAPASPSRYLSPAGDYLLLATPLRYPPLSDLAKPMLRLAGVRVNPGSNGRYGGSYLVDFSLVRVSDGASRSIEAPPEARIFNVQWSPGGRHFAFLNEAPGGIELWVGDAEAGTSRKIAGVLVNPLLYNELAWMPDGASLLVKLVPNGRGAPPARPAAPPGPRIQEGSGASASSTYEARDLLTGPHDESLFEYYATSQLAMVDSGSGRISLIGKPALLADVESSPDGSRFLVSTIGKPFSYSHAWERFPDVTEVWDRQGKVIHVVAKHPLADQVPIHGVAEGPRAITWRPTKPATLVWVEALDGGDPGRKATHRDRMMIQEAPFKEEAREIHRAPHRISGWWWGEEDGLLIVGEYERERRWRHAWLIDPDGSGTAPRHIIDVSTQDRYNDPGAPVMRRLPNGGLVLAQDGNAIFLSGTGSTPAGDRPFLDRLSLATLESERLFRSDSTGYEFFSGWVGLPGKSFLVGRDSRLEPPNSGIRTITTRRDGSAAGEAAWNSGLRMLTSFPDPTPQIRDIRQQIVTYERADGTPLSFTLYLPPGYKEGTRLPVVLEAYPLEYSDAGTAGQVSGSDRRFTRLSGYSSLFFLLDGYAVLQNVAMPVIGDPDTMYNTFIEQLVASAEAAVKKAVDMGVADPERIGVMGHSHGALMTATLLAHSDLFRSGIARSGAYNHTMRPFGFQGERRTLWEASENYVRLSPVMHADRINEPLLLIHGEADQNPGTVPLQSEKLFESVRGTGGTARLVMLPHEQHGYQSREAVEQVIAEQLAWFDRYVKKAAPRAAQ